MKKILCLILYILLISPLNAKTEIDKAFKQRTPQDIIDKTFSLYSPDIYEGQKIREEQVFNKYGCKGQNISPKLVWKNAPVNTKSFAITMFDPDANTKSGWWHWVIYNIPANINKIEVGANNNKKLMPKGSTEGTNDYGMSGFGGVCTPKGEKHNYVITIYALDVEKLKLPKKPTSAMINLSINKHIIETAKINAFYERGVKKNSSNQTKFNFNSKTANKKVKKNVVVEE
ncbi:MAG TPA: YbhB/YbcL family Raf kinase inhibitor-like protein [Rickettsiales bacterium]|nr:YbhB/YbcL family Raf kinase inhibitor-like protein [Rickettsiales bacterium]